MNADQKRIVKSFYVPILFVALLWLVKLTEIEFALNLVEYGILPRQIEGLLGILTMPFIHQDLKHLFSNSIPLVILGASLVYFYRETSLRVFILIYLLDGIWLWLGGRENYHIGASGIVYGLASFLFFSGIFRKYIRLMAISMLVVFLYGGMVWGLFPIFIGVSWEAHLFGALAGMLCAWVYRIEGPQRPVYEWENEEDDDVPTLDENGEPIINEGENIHINYQYKPSDENTDDNRKINNAEN